VSVPAALVLLSRPGCHLCHDLRQVVERVLPDFAATLTERDVREDPELRARYALEIPVLLLEGRELLRHRGSEDDVRAALRAAGVASR
jgi:hypothetical protein